MAEGEIGDDDTDDDSPVGERAIQLTSASRQGIASEPASPRGRHR